MIQQFFLPALQEWDLDNIWLQEDGATANIFRVSMSVLREPSPNELIFLREYVNWPARSPDFSPHDYFQWAYLKSLVYKHRSKTLKDLWNNI
ncbi:uncharacterized protein TNCV_1108411 [Trichonephila clavipes]|nr:uncharacterized protein TNCV_1108411 [Trichonephila clavipes]